MTTKQDLKPKYFPVLHESREPSISQDNIDMIAFVLAGVDPDERTNTKQNHSDLRSLAADPSAKPIGSNSAMRDDHMYILAPRFDFSLTDFDEIWQDSKRVPSGQESTDLLKLVKALQRLEIDEEGTELRSSKNAGLVKRIREHSHRILYRIHRSAVRHIQETVKSSLAPTSQPWFGSILNRVGMTNRTRMDRVNVNDEIKIEAESYLTNAIRIGRILRVAERRV